MLVEKTDLNTKTPIGCILSLEILESNHNHMNFITHKNVYISVSLAKLGFKFFCQWLCAQVKVQWDTGWQLLIQNLQKVAEVNYQYDFNDNTEYLLEMGSKHHSSLHMYMREIWVVCVWNRNQSRKNVTLCML